MLQAGEAEGAGPEEKHSLKCFKKQQGNLQKSGLKQSGLKICGQDISKVRDWRFVRLE